MIDKNTFVLGGRAYICNCCENRIIGDVIILHWEKENFTLCGDCLKRLAIKHIFTDLIFNEEIIVNRKTISEELRDKIYKKCNFKCVECGSTEDLEIDHIVPFSLGGRTELENLQLLCKKCNLKKGKKWQDQISKV
jgi:hypothetical protein